MWGVNSVIRKASENKVRKKRRRERTGNPTFIVKPVVCSKGNYGQEDIVCTVEIALAVQIRTNVVVVVVVVVEMSVKRACMRN